MTTDFSLEGGRFAETFTWDPRADQVFTPDDSKRSGQLVGEAASFDKYEGCGFCATGSVLVVILDDEGTTMWGRSAGAAPHGGPTVIETSAPDGGILFGSNGRLVIGNLESPAELRVNHASIDASNSGVDQRIGMQLAAHELELTNVVVEISNGSSLRVGSEVATIDWALISVRDGGVCHLVPKQITVKSDLRVVIGDGSSAYLGDATWDFKQGSAVQFSLDGTSAPDSRNYCYLSGFDFFSDSYLPTGMFNFITKGENGSPLKNNGEFVFADIGNGFQWASMLEKKLIAIDGVVVTDPRLIPEDFTDGDLHIHLA